MLLGKNGLHGLQASMDGIEVMGTKEQYEHSDAIHERANRHIARPGQYQFSEHQSDVKNIVRVDDYCRKCGDVTVHELYAKSVAHSGSTECTVCGYTDIA